MMRKRVTSLVMVVLIMLILRQDIHASKCHQWHDTKGNSETLKVKDCAVTYGNLPLQDQLRNLPESTNLEANAKCDREQTRIKLEITWSTEGSYLENNDLTYFYLTIRDDVDKSSFPSLSVFITPNETTIYEHKIHFSFLYDGLNVEGPEIVRNGRYSVTLQYVTMELEENEIKSAYLSKQKLKKKAGIEDSYCLTQLLTTTETVVSPVPPTLIITLSVIIGLVLVVAAAGIAAYKCKIQRANGAMNYEMAQNILILLNLEDRSEVTRQTNWAATALSRASGLGRLTVKYNRWETTEIAEIGIMRWLHDKVTWANKIVISSTPDDLRNEETAHILEEAFRNIIGHVGSSEKLVFVIYFQDEENYQKCPFMAHVNYRKFHLEEEWKSFCRSIWANSGGENEPLQNGSRV